MLGYKQSNYKVPRHAGFSYGNLVFNSGEVVDELLVFRRISCTSMQLCQMHESLIETLYLLIS